MLRVSGRTWQDWLAGGWRIVVLLVGGWVWRAALVAVLGCTVMGSALHAQNFCIA